MKKYLIWPCMALIAYLSGCQDAFLDAKPDKALVVPSSAADLQALLDNFNTMSTPGLNLIAGDEFSTTSQMLQSLEYVERQTFLWADDLYSGSGSLDWEACYKAVLTANIVIESVGGLDRATSPGQASNLLGYALFYRANAFYGLAQQYAAPYNAQTARSQPGIPLKLTSQVSQTIARASLWQTYQQILDDLGRAKSLISGQSTWKNRPSRAAVLALLARVQLSMGDYEQAEQSASACLSERSELIDFNTVDAGSALTFPDSPERANQEVLYYSRMNFYLFFFTPYYQVDSVLYASYQQGDLRRQCFFDTLADGAVWFKGSYAGSFGFFSGLATDEVYLIRAECLARQGKTQPALADLNTLLEKRFKKGAFKAVTASNAQTALQIILSERKKELVARGTRWTDLRRLNQESAHQITLRRRIDGKEYVLAPQSPRYTFPIPENEISASGIQQNPR